MARLFLLKSLISHRASVLHRALGTGALLTLSASVSFAADVDRVGGSNPGFYSMMVGDIEITALSDGTVRMPVQQLLHMPEAQAEAMLDADFTDVPVETSVNAYLVNTGEHLVLIDSGAGELFGPSLGKLMASLSEAGYRPEQIDEVYITHLHPDHAGGLMNDEARAFPNAVVRADQNDIDFWLDPANLEAAPEADKGGFRGAMASLNPYREVGALKAFAGAESLVPGIRSQPSPGHTPGHSTYRVESQGETLLLWGDLMHVAAVQFARPEITIDFDSDADAAREQRQSAFADAAEQGYWVAAAHLSFPGIGHLRADGDGYRWIPVNYSHSIADD